MTKTMNPYLEALQPKLSPADFKKLAAIDNPNVHEFIAKESDLCQPKDIFNCLLSDVSDVFVGVAADEDFFWVAEVAFFGDELVDNGVVDGTEFLEICWAKFGL